MPLALQELRQSCYSFGDEVWMTRVATAACKYCVEPLRPGASYCTNCKRFQTLRSRLAGELNFQALIALVPIVTLSIAFLNKTIVVPYSRVHAAVLRCTSDELTAAIQNTGTRTAIVEGGLAQFIPTKVDYNRALEPAGATYQPVIVQAGEATVARFSFAELGTNQPLPTPQLPPAQKCTYGISLSVVEFGGRKNEVQAGNCTCPSQ